MHCMYKAKFQVESAVKSKYISVRILLKQLEYSLSISIMRLLIGLVDFSLVNYHLL